MNAIRWVVSCILGCCCVNNCYAQYNRVTEQNGVQIFRENAVAVSFAGNPPTLIGDYVCGYGPYEIGYDLNFFLRIQTPISYTFNFATPVNHIRIDAGLFWSNDILSVSINGQPYSLTNSNLAYSHSECDFDTGIIVGGFLTAPPGSLPRGIVDYYAGLLSIKQSTGVTSVTIEYMGFIHPRGFSGFNISFYFGQIMATNSGPVCSGSEVQLNGDSSITESGNFYWTGPNGYTSTQQHPTIKHLGANDTGIYTLLYINGTDSLIDTTYVGLLPGPDQPEISATTNPICEGETLQLTTTNSTGVSYSWQGPKELAETSTSVTIFNTQEYHEGDYLVTATQYTCSLSDTLHITVNHPVIYKTTEVACENEGYIFNNKHLKEAGIYIDTLTAANGCDSFSQLQLILLPSPNIDILADKPHKLCMGDTVNLTSDGANNYEWYNGLNSISTTSTIQTVLSELKNDIMVVGIATNTCTDTARIVIEAEPCCQVIIPTAFTPNGDGKNDFFRATPKGYIKAYKMEVFNRWGEQVYVGQSLGNKWDGLYKGSLAEQGVYYYTFRAECSDGTKIQRKGDVVLLR